MERQAFVILLGYELLMPMYNKDGIGCMYQSTVNRRAQCKLVKKETTGAPYILRAPSNFMSCDLVLYLKYLGPGELSAQVEDLLP